MANVTTRITLPEETLVQVQSAVDEGAAPSLSAAVRVALALWLKEQGGAHALDLPWADYVAALQTPRTSYHGSAIHLLGEGSYVEELNYAELAFKDHGSFAKMPERVRERVSGFGDSNGYLGNMTAARHFKPVVKDSPETIAEHLDRIPLGGPVSLDLAEEVLDGLRSIHGVGLGSATRLLSVKRPDVFFPVNGANLDVVKETFGRLRYQLPNGTKDYLAILRRVRAFRWFVSARPSAGAVPDSTLWPYRVALMDALVYAPDLEADE